MAFALFILVNATLFIRPGEFMPQLAGVPIYLMAILSCMVVASPKLIAQWARQPFSERPISLCMIGLLAGVILSHAAHLDLAEAYTYGIDFARVVVYFLLLVGLVDTPRRLRLLFGWIFGFVLLMGTAAVLAYHGVIDVAALTPLERHDEVDAVTGQPITMYQLVGTGTFNDPNDLSLILATGFLVGLFFLTDRKLGFARLAVLAGLAMMVYAQTLTQSRGGLLAWLAGLGVLLAVRVGPRWTIVLTVAGLPVLLTVLGGRMARLSMSEGTAQARIHLWRDAMILFRQSPLFGIGTDNLADEIGLVAHNSFVQCFAEMGLLGAAMFVGVFFFATRGLFLAGSPAARPLDPDLRRMRGYLLALLAALAVGQMTLTRCYVISTYITIGLCEAYQLMVFGQTTRVYFRLDMKNVLGLVIVTGACLVSILIAIRLLVQ